LALRSYSWISGGDAMALCRESSPIYWTAHASSSTTSKTNFSILSNLLLGKSSPSDLPVGISK
jgi:hypothetical protein